MENQKHGFIPLYRSILKKPWAKDVYLRTLWDNLLFAAQRQPYTARFKGREWHLSAGQLVTTAADLGLGLCDRNGQPVSRDAVVRMLKVFEREGMISMEGEKQKGTVITITNYAEYAQKTDDLPAHEAAHIAAHDKASNGAGSEGVAAHEAAQTPAQHEQQYINNNIKRSSFENSDESPNAPSENDFPVKPDAAISSPKGNKWGSPDDLHCAEWIAGLVASIRPAVRKPNLTTWANDVRLMREIDGRTHREICELFKWASRDGFWCSNILSPAKLRAKWDTLSLQRDATPRRAAAPALDYNNTDWIHGVIE